MVVILNKGFLVASSLLFISRLLTLHFYDILLCQAGDAKFLEEALKFAYGKNCAALKDGRIQGVQALSGTGGLRVMGEMLAKHGHKEIYVPNPTWGNHKAIFTVCIYSLSQALLLPFCRSLLIFPLPHNFNQ